MIGQPIHETELNPTCLQGHVPMISVNGLHQLHIFIFFLAVFHVVYSAITMTLGRLKVIAVILEISENLTNLLVLF